MFSDKNPKKHDKDEIEEEMKTGDDKFTDEDFDQDFDDVIIKDSDEDIDENSKELDEDQIIDPRVARIQERLSVIINELCDILEIKNPESLGEKLRQSLLLLFPNARDIDDIFDGKKTEDYAKDLIQFIINNKKFLKELSLHQNNYKPLSYDLTSPNGLSNFFNNVNDLFQMHRLEIKINHKYLSDLLSISNLFINSKETKKIMTKLEEELINYANLIGAKLEPITLGVKTIYVLPPSSKDKPFDKQKILSGFFYAWARKNNFNQEVYAKLHSLVNTDEFLDLLANGIVFKDKGAPIMHGPWAHLVQLYYVVEENKLHPFLTNKPEDIFSYLGKPECKGKVMFVNWQTGVASLPLTTWDTVFDRTNPGVKDYGTPEHITASLSKRAKTTKLKNKKWPLLSDLFSRQMASQNTKRNGQNPVNEKKITEAVTLHKYPIKKN